MRSSNTETAATITVQIALLGRATTSVTLPADSTVADAFEVAGITLNNGDTPMVEGVRAEPHNVLDDGDIITVSANKVGGLE